MGISDNHVNRIIKGGSNVLCVDEEGKKKRRGETDEIWSVRVLPGYSVIQIKKRKGDNCVKARP